MVSQKCIEGHVVKNYVKKNFHKKRSTKILAMKPFKKIGTCLSKHATYERVNLQYQFYVTQP